jgi:hypothetical protein
LGSLKADDFGRYLNEIAEGLDRFEIHTAVVNIDNAPWHCSAEEQWAEICERFAQHGILRDWNCSYDWLHTLTVARQSNCSGALSKWA